MMASNSRTVIPKTHSKARRRRRIRSRRSGVRFSWLSFMRDCGKFSIGPQIGLEWRAMRIFFNDAGRLRSGWRVLLFGLAFFIIILLLVNTVLRLAYAL